MDLLSKEKEVVGIYLSGHPLDDYRFEIENFTNISTNNESINYLDDSNIVEADSGMPDGSLTQEECFKEAEKMGISDAHVWSWNGWPNGCIKTGEKD